MSELSEYIKVIESENETVRKDLLSRERNVSRE